MNTSEFLLGALRSEGLTRAFMVPGGLIDGFSPALAMSPGLTPTAWASSTPVTPFDRAKKERHDDV